MLTTFIVTLGVMLLFCAGLAIRLLLVPGGQVRGTCSSSSPFTQRHGRCGTCGKAADEACGKTSAPAQPGNETAPRG